MEKSTRFISLFLLVVSSLAMEPSTTANESFEPDELKEKIKKREFEAIAAKICPRPQQKNTCFGLITSEFAQMGGTDSQITKQTFEGGREHVHYRLANQFLVKSFAAEDELELDHAIHEVNLGLRVKDSIRVNGVTNLLPLQSCCLDQTEGIGRKYPRFWLVFRLHPLGSLTQFLANKDKQHLVNSGTWKFVAVEGLLSGLASLHEREYIHRDLKLDNVIMADDWSPLLGDFGFAKKFGPDVNTVGGTPFFQAPEMKKEQAYDLPLDVWNAAAMIFYITVPKSYKWTQDWADVARTTCEGLSASKLTMDDDVFIHCKYFHALVVDMLNEDPKKRPTARQALERVWEQIERIIQHQNLVYGNFAQELRTNRLPANHRFWGILRTAYQNTQVLFQQLKGNEPAATAHIRKIHPGWFNQEGAFLDDARLSWARIYYQNFIMADPQIPELKPDPLIRV